MYHSFRRLYSLENNWFTRIRRWIDFDFDIELEADDVLMER